MISQFSEQVKKSSKPMNKLVAMNAQKWEQLAQMQTEFFTGFMADSVKYVESVSVQTEVKGVIAAQTSYAEALKERFAHASKDTYGAINDIREEYTDLLKTSLDENVANAPAKKATAKKAATKPTSKPVAKPAVKSEAKPAVKAKASLKSDTTKQ